MSRAILTIEDTDSGGFDLKIKYVEGFNHHSQAHQAAVLLTKHMDTLGERQSMSEVETELMLSMGTPQAH